MRTHEGTTEKISYLARSIWHAAAVVAALLISAATATAEEPPAGAADAQDVAILRALLGVAPPPAAQAAAAPQPAAPAPAATIEPVMARLAKIAAQRQTVADQPGSAPADDISGEGDDGQVSATSSQTADALALGSGQIAGTPGYQLSRALDAAKTASERLQLATP
ncbi:MAG TPA: hypothetical protein VEL28_20425 [Candidatus Binatia bacterium]|nr:hypothetical protein [Candidatus Binatia bacterium]